VVEIAESLFFGAGFSVADKTADSGKEEDPGDGGHVVSP
jgi:hypothetical protein